MPFFKRNEGKSLFRRRSLYEPLPGPTSFRLLELCAADNNDEIRCGLRIADISQKPLYNAISYTWGTDTATTIIQVNGYEVNILQTAAEMLRDLRSSTDSQTLWIDTICINQSDTKEKNHQVQQMAKIFSTAVCVISWLRDDSLISEIFDHLPEKQQRGLSFLWLKPRFERFFNHRYWTRRWIIQEVALARSALVKCGSRLVPLARVSELVEFCQNHYSHDYSSSLAMRLCLLQNSGIRKEITFTRLLDDYKSTQCVDARDKVFALVGLSDASRQHFTVDYSYSPIELVLATVDFCSTYKNLENSTTFGVSLAKELGLDKNDLVPEDGMTYRLQNPPLVRSSLFERGHVISDVVPPEFFDRVEAMRNTCGAMSNYPNLPGLSFDNDKLQVKDLAGLGPDKRTSVGNVALISSKRIVYFEQVSPKNLFPFLWKELPSGKTCVGLATFRVQKKDKILQVPEAATPWILHVSGSGCKIVARALVFPTNEGTGKRPSIEKYVVAPGTKRYTLVTRGWQTLYFMRLMSSRVPPVSDTSPDVQMKLIPMVLQKN